MFMLRKRPRMSRICMQGCNVECCSPKHILCLRPLPLNISVLRRPERVSRYSCTTGRDPCFVRSVMTRSGQVCLRRILKSISPADERSLLMSACRCVNIEFRLWPVVQVSSYGSILWRSSAHITSASLVVVHPVDVDNHTRSSVQLSRRNEQI